ncbi:P1 family peptidase [Aminirod propionatiphilus]|uniref:P1 family peptidase n=1 Tax=Aminirod propionatiphilus TaxID=3415223 RepID=A0ACD1DUP0_9BACT|nr:P1 family peptidase [Synergistota bacterium]
MKGFRIGHGQDRAAATGVTVVLCEEGASAGVDVRGGAPATRETDLLAPVNLVKKIHAVFLAGGSAFGLDAASGIMTYLEERGVGFDVAVTTVPIVCGAALFDLTVGDGRVRPDRFMGYQACLDAVEEEPARGSVGAGTGASVGKFLGMERAMKSGIGWSLQKEGELEVAALVAVNCLGDVFDPERGCLVAGLRDGQGRQGDTEREMIAAWREKRDLFGGNTTLGVVLTNGAFTKAQMGKLASMAHDGYGRTLRPAHSMVDGDTIFALSRPVVEADLSVVGILAVRAVERAVVDAVVQASSLAGLPAPRDLAGRI